MSIAARAVKGVGWVAGGGLVQALLGAAALAILTRALTPAEFGVAAAALAAIALIDAICALILPDVLRGHDRIDDSHIDATFWCAVLIATASAIVISLFAPHIAVLFGAQDASAVFVVAAWLLPIGAAAATPAALLSRELKFREGASISAVTSLAGFVTGIALAMSGFGVWSLIAMEFARRVSSLALGMACVSWRPGFRGGVRALTSLARFNAHSALFYGLGYLDDFVVRLLISRMLGIEVLGVYAMARRLLEAVQGAVLGPFSGVTLSASAQLRGQRPAMAAMVLTLYQASVVVALPVFLGLIAAAPILVPLAFGAQWSPAVAPLQVLLVLGLSAATGAFNAGILRGSGYAGLMNAMRALGLIIVVVLAPLAAPFGLIAVCAALVARAWLIAPLGVVFISKATSLSVIAQTAPARAVAPAAFTMFVIAWLLVQTLSSWPPMAALASIILVSITVYLITLALTAPRIFKLLRGLGAALARRDRGAFDRLLAIPETAQPADRSPA